MKLRHVGIVGYGAYIPRNRITVSDIATAWNKKPEELEDALKVYEKSVPSYDEDTITLSVEASRNALIRAGVSATDIGAVYIGSESHPYAVKPSATVVAEALGNNNEYLAADTEFACKAGTAALQMVAGLLESNLIDYGLAIGADTSQGAPGDILEYSAGAGAAAFILGRKRDEFVAELEAFSSFSSDTPDFWRRNLARYPSHGGRFTGEPAYFRHVIECTELFLSKNKMKLSEFDHVVFHMPNGKFPRSVAKKLGVSDQQLSDGLIVEHIGNPYSASSILGLTSVLDHAKPGARILMTSYGSGAGSDSFAFTVTERIQEVKKKARTTDWYLKHKTNVSYVTYLQLKEKLQL